jgi:hypothetical protein
LVPFSGWGIRSLFFPGFHYLALSTLALSHRFSGLLFLDTSRVYFTPKHSWDFPSELSPLRDRFLLPSFRFEDPCHFTVGCFTHRMRDCYVIRVITTALQFGFRAFFPLKARSHQSRD